MSKGSNRRPAQIPDDQLETNWRKIFKKPGRSSLAEVVQDCSMEEAKEATAMEAAFLRVLSTSEQNTSS